jgi:hypothetical protein
MVAERSLVDEGVTHGRFDDALNFSIEDEGRTEEDGGSGRQGPTAATAAAPAGDARVSILGRFQFGGSLQSGRLIHL